MNAESFPHNPDSSERTKTSPAGHPQKGTGEADCTGHKIFINGRFLAALPAGVHRVAEEMVIAVDRLLVSDPALAAAFDLTLAIPGNIRRHPKLDQVHSQPMGQLTQIFWEQLDLPRLTLGGLCVSLCNVGPLARRDAITMMHDAQVFSMPASYSPAFRLWYRFAQPLIGRRHKRILTVSEFSKSELVHYGIAPAEKITVIPNGSDHILRIPPDHTATARLELQGTPYILALANVQYHKNIRILLETFADPALQHTTLALFGSATKTDFESMGHKVPANVRFLGRISDAELAGLMLGAVGFACPSVTEGFGLPPLEAMQLGCPVIAAPCGALPEVCGDAALFADPHDAAAWADQISRLAANEAIRNEMRTKGSRQAEKFTWDRSARRLLRTIADVQNMSVPTELLS